MKSTLKRFIVCAVRCMVHLFGQAWGRRVRNILREAISVDGIDATVEIVEVARGSMRFYCLGDLAKWRTDTLLTKEPETIEWIDGFDAEDVFFDVGANVGIYSVYAAVIRGCRVFAFEPGAANYFLLNRNIQENAAEDRIQGYCLALNDCDMLDQLHMRDTGFAHSMASFATPVGSDGNTFTATFKQGAVGLSLDSFIHKFGASFPTYLKIDVDGIEERIINGAAATLADPRLKSVLVELDTALETETNRIIGKLETAGLALAERRRSPMFDGHRSRNNL